MNERKQKSTGAAPKSKLLRVGFVPLTDCAPLILAQELGLFANYNLNVQLRQEVGWASIRDGLSNGDIQRMHMLIGMPIASTMGLLGSPAKSSSLSNGTSRW